MKNVCPTNAASCVDKSVVAFVSPLPLCFLAVDWTLHENTPETSLSPDLPSWSMTEAVKGGALWYFDDTGTAKSMGDDLVN